MLQKYLAWHFSTVMWLENDVIVIVAEGDSALKGQKYFREM